MDNQDIDNPAPAERLPPRPPLLPPGSFMRLPGVKFIVIGLLSVLLLLPALLVWALVEERAERATEVATRIAAGWGGEQTINGPYIAVPLNIITAQTNTSGQVVNVRETRWALIMPEVLDVKATMQSEVRRLSIYALPVYNLKLALKGRFSANPTLALGEFEGVPDFSRAFLVLHIADIKGIRSAADIRIDNGTPLPFEPGMRTIKAMKAGYTSYHGQTAYAQSLSGISRPLDTATVTKGFSFDMEIALNGSSRLSVAPAGQTTTLEAAANWPDPGFEGLFLPESKEINAKGFRANWTIPYLARGVNKAMVGEVLPLSESLMSINLIEPVKFYQMVSRTLKYSIGFISIVFFAVFIIELKGGRMVHWVQYVLTGLALIIFYIMLLALSEHIGFAPAYGVAAIATTVLIAAYVGSVTDSRRNASALALVLGLSYAVLYLILREDEYALLAGALIAFVTIAATMYFTRNVDWSGSARRDN